MPVTLTLSKALPECWAVRLFITLLFRPFVCLFTCLFVCMFVQLKWFKYPLPRFCHKITGQSDILYYVCVIRLVAYTAQSSTSQCVLCGSFFLICLSVCFFLSLVILCTQLKWFKYSLFFVLPQNCWLVWHTNMFNYVQHSACCFLSPTSQCSVLCECLFVLSCLFACLLV